MFLNAESMESGGICSTCGPSRRFDTFLSGAVAWIGGPARIDGVPLSAFFLEARDGMDRESGREPDEFAKDLADGLEYGRRGLRDRRLPGLKEKNSQLKLILYAAAGLVLVVVLAVVFLGGGNDATTERVASMEARIAGMENRLTRLEGLESKMASFEPGRLEHLEKESDLLKKEIRSLSASLRVSKPDQKKERPPSSKGRIHVVEPKDTLYGIARRYGVPLNEICRLNRMKPNDAIHPGQKLLVTPAKN
jgi:LysM repeat protein